MTKWTIDGSQAQADPGHADPPFISEHFLTEDGAKQFAILLTERGYAVVARTLGEDGKIVALAGAALVTWMNAE